VVRASVIKLEKKVIIHTPININLLISFLFFFHQVNDAETEAAHWQEELKAQQQHFEQELDKHRQEAELLRVSG
jgi:hypothetical protein